SVGVPYTRRICGFVPLYSSKVLASGLNTFSNPSCTACPLLLMTFGQWHAESNQKIPIVRDASRRRCLGKLDHVSSAAVGISVCLNSSCKAVTALCRRVRQCRCRGCVSSKIPGDVKLCHLDYCSSIFGNLQLPICPESQQRLPRCRRTERAEASCHAPWTRSG